ncbi:hypothetical protein OOU_Y34scaffold00174g53 [Pyricularia oryzae Y34]|uniref:Uncharacterized protein n=2 Tax=Pyricularia oryzae TaxID=318829 RepID=A0AA97PQL6_PYRO3|nr:hypothetical protein OOU_Y34scaffold00174g53 [Pyricularia oryzae Y34]
MIVTDASPQKYWSNLFFYGQAAHIFAELVGPVMGPALIENSLWQPLLLGLGQPLSFLQGLCATDNLNRRPAARKPVRLKKARTLPLSKGLCSLAAESRSYNGMLCHSGCGPKHTYGGNR